MAEALSVATIAALLAAGVVIGLLSGLLGIGGGVVIVPVLLEIGAAEGLDPALAADLAIGTAHGAVLLASVSAAVAHGRAGRVDGALLRAWLPPMLGGAVAGLVLGRVVAAPVLVGTFAMVAALLGAMLLAGGRAMPATRPPEGAMAVVPPALVGLLAAALGIGGGTLSGPVLALLSVPLVRAIGAGAVFNIAVALPATAAFVWGGLDVPGRPPASLGHVALVPLALLTLPALLAGPWAARLAPRVPVTVLRRGFALCLLAIAARMGWGVLG